MLVMVMVLVQPGKEPLDEVVWLVLVALMALMALMALQVVRLLVKSDCLGPASRYERGIGSLRWIDMRSVFLDKTKSSRIQTMLYRPKKHMKPPIRFISCFVYLTLNRVVCMYY